jgi:hypothetical protein
MGTKMVKRAKDKDLERVQKSVNEPKRAPAKTVEPFVKVGGRPRSRDLPKGEKRVEGGVRIRIGSKTRR